jgi:hypothetical protein
MKDQIVNALKGISITDLDIEEIPYGKFISESRMNWDYVFPEMKTEGKPVTYISFEFPDTPEGREASHYAEWTIGWIPQNIRYVER